MSSAYRAAGFLHAIVVDLIKQYSSCSEKQGGVLQNLDALRLNIERIRRQEDPKATKTIGFFGGQKRGKSSLINQLLGCKLMPVRAVPLSSIVVRAKKDMTIQPDCFKVKVTYADGYTDEQDASLDDARFLLETYGTRLGNFSDHVADILVKSNFPLSKILEEEGILVDTPGAEYAFGVEDPDDAPENSDFAKLQNEVEKKRALSVLDKTQIIVFCERADYLENRNSQRFYQEELKKRYPINVLNFMDKYDSEDFEKIPEDMREQFRQNKMRQRMAATFGATIDRICCVSCKDAIDGREKNDIKLQKRSNISVLEENILAELRNLLPQFGLPLCLDRLAGILQQVNVSQKILTINELFMENFISSFNEYESFENTIKKARSFCGRHKESR